MKLGVILSHKDLYPEEKMELEVLLQNIPSIVILGVLAGINSRLYIEEKKAELQAKILNEIFLRRQSQDIQNDVRNRVINFFRAHPDIEFTNHAIFSERPILMFMEYELMNFREEPRNWEDTTPQMELNIFKTILIFNARLDEKIQSVSQLGKVPFTDYYAIHWPLVAPQYDLQVTSNPLYQMLKGIILISELKRSKELSPYVSKFLEINKRVSIHDYAMEIMNLVQYCMNDENQGMFSRTGFTILSNSGFIPTFYDSNCIKPSDYIIETRYAINFIGLRSKPLIKFEANQYLVFHWNFLVKKLYEGLIFDFINVSGAEKELGLNYSNFKSKYSDKIIEKIVFKNVMSYSLSGKGRFLHFAEKSAEPDLYFRQNNDVMIFEFKDCSFASDAIETSTFENIREEIERKICTYDSSGEKKAKGIGQLINNIKAIAEGGFDFDSNASINKLTIQPVLVVTDAMFEMPGVNHYINKVFRENITPYRDYFNKIEDVTIVNFDFLFTYISEIKRGEYKLQELFSNYTNYIRYREKQYSSTNRRNETFNEVYISLSAYLAKKLTFKKDLNFTKIMFEIFDLTYGLPKST